MTRLVSVGDKVERAGCRFAVPSLKSGSFSFF